MRKPISIIFTSLATLSFFTGCGGSGSDSTIPKSVIKDITDNYTIARGSTLNLDGSLSSDDVEIISHTWTIGDETVSTKEIDTLPITLNTGSYKLCLTTEDEDGKSNKTCKTIKVIASQETNPTAIINNVPTSGWKTKCNITLNANASQPAFERTLTNYKWFKDGVEIGYDVNQAYVFNTAGEHNITLEVTDDQGSKNSATKIVQIAEIGRPTAKLTLRNVENKLIFSDESNVDGKTWEMSDSDTNTPYKSNYVFLSAGGSYDDCDLTDDNLTFKWNASIYNASDMNTAPVGVDGIQSCFHNKSELRDEPIYFNGTLFVPINTKNQSGNINSGDTNAITRNPDGTYNLTNPSIDINQTYKYPFVEVVDGRISGWEGWKGWRDEKWEKAYASMCTVAYDYIYFKVTLTVIDNLHDINTTVTKIVETRYTNTVNPDTNESIDRNHPHYGEIINPATGELVN